jgi:hypothetical protein
MGELDELAWDWGNLSHLDERNARRRSVGEGEISREEVDALYGSADYVTRAVEYLTRTGEWESQLHLIGRTLAGRFLTVACQVDDDGRFRPVTIWPSEGYEIALYRGEMNDDGND